MNRDIVIFLRRAFPFLLTVGLWRLAMPIWNPGGMLAIIPIFYCSFVRPIDWFPMLSVIFCFLIDYNAGTLFFWTALYCLVYAINGFQNYVDVVRAPHRGIWLFTAYVAIGILVLFFRHMSFATLARALWLIIWLCALYTPITVLIDGARNDR